MTAQRPKRSGHPVLDAIVFLAEIAVYVCVAVAAGRVHLWLGVVAVLAMAIWWGALHAPKARWRLPRIADRALRCAWFLIGLGCAGAILTR